MKASEAIVILEALDPSTEVTLIISRTPKVKLADPQPGYQPGFTMPMVNTTWPDYPQFTVTCKNVH
jgi:hypothetical protein